MGATVDSDPLSVLDPSPRTRETASAPSVTERDAAEQRAREDYQYATDRARREFDEDYRQRLARDLRDQAAVRRAQGADLSERILDADARGNETEATAHTAERLRVWLEAEHLQDRASRVEAGADIDDVELSGRDWERVNDSVGDLAPGPVETDDRSALTGDDGPRPVDTTRRYNERGGLRPPLRIHQTDLERAMPRDASGQVARHADPRAGNWFGLVNDGGPEADPTRSINCGDTVLSLYETYMHGRPRVSAPRTFDGYHRGDPHRPMGAERGVSARIESTTGGRFEGLTDVTGRDPQDARAEVRLAESRVRTHLLTLGHGAFGFLTTQDQAGRTHAIAAVNHNGRLLYLDAQNRTISENVPLQTHSGVGYPSDVVRMDALTIDGRGRYRPMTGGDVGSFITADPEGSTPVGATPTKPEGEPDAAGTESQPQTGSDTNENDDSASEAAGHGGGYDLRGEDPLSIVPDDATVRELTPHPSGGSQYGLEFKWKNEAGKTVRLRIHGPDGTAPAESNSATGETYRVQIGSRYQDEAGNLFHAQVHNPNSPNYNPAAANESHIPWPEQFPGL